MNQPDENQMCCISCGHIAKEDDPYESKHIAGDKSCPICPECGVFNIGGYDSFAPAGIISDENMKVIIELNEEVS